MFTDSAGHDSHLDAITHTARRHDDTCSFSLILSLSCLCSDSMHLSAVMGQVIGIPVEFKQTSSARLKEVVRESSDYVSDFALRSFVRMCVSESRGIKVRRT